MQGIVDALSQAGQRGCAPAPAEELDPLAAWRPLLPVALPLGVRPAAVLVVLFEEHGQARVVLTRRSEDLRRHRGQVSFPGGGIDPGEQAVEAALREAFEEIDLDPDTVEVVGWLHPLFTYTGSSLVLPIVGVVPRRPTLSPNPAEVARVFDVGLADLVGEGVYQEAEWDPYEASSSVPAQLRRIWFFGIDGERVWGATARIVYELALLALGIEPSP